MKDKRNPIAETILEVDDEEDSPEVEEALSDWLDEADTPVIDSSNPVNIKPISQVISKNDSNNIDAHSVRNNNASKDSHLIDDVIVEEKINKMPSVTQHAQGSKTFTASDSSAHTAVSSASANKYDSTQRTLSHQTVISETKRSPVAPVGPVAPVAPVSSSGDCLGTLPLTTQKSSDSDMKKDNAEISKRKVGTKSINTVTTSPLNKITKDNDNIDTKKEEIEKANVKSNAKQKNVTEIKKKTDDAKKMEKEKEKEKEVENENVTENEEIIKENYKSKENLEIKTIIISPILKSSSSIRSTESEEFGKNFSPLFPEPNYVSPSLTAPLGAEGEETLEVRTHQYLHTYLLSLLLLLLLLLYIAAVLLGTYYHHHEADFIIKMKMKMEIIKMNTLPCSTLFYLGWSRAVRNNIAATYEQ